MSLFRAKKIVYFVRHGQSRANVTPVFQGLHSPLTDIGKEQAELVAGRAAKLSFDALIASPLTRAHSTAEAIAAKTGKTLEYSDLFVERRKPTSLNDKSFANPIAAALWHRWDESMYMPGLRVEDGENYDDYVMRIDAALTYLRKRPEHKLLVVTHAFFLQALIARVVLGDALTGEALRRFLYRSLMENTGLSALKYGRHLDGNQWRLWVFNDHAHLA